MCSWLQVAHDIHVIMWFVIKGVKLCFFIKAQGFHTKNKSGLGLQHLHNCGNKTESHFKPNTLGYTQQVRINSKNNMQILRDPGLVSTQQLSKKWDSSSCKTNFITFQLCKCTVCISLHPVSSREETLSLSYNQLGLCKSLHIQTISV